MPWVLHVQLVACGLGTWGIAWLLWRSARPAPVLFHVACLPAVLSLYVLGYILLIFGLGLDLMAGAWYWDTWLLLGSAAVVADACALTRFRGLLRLTLALLPVAGVGLFWYLTP